MAMGPLPSGRATRRRAPMAEINVTPMVDVMLVLLIIFMVTAPLLVTGVPVNLPASKASALDQKDKPVQISMDAKGRVFVDKDEVADAELSGRLAALADEGAPDRQVYVRADKDLDWGQVMRVMGELNHAGLNKVALVSTSGSEK